MNQVSLIFLCVWAVIMTLAIVIVLVYTVPLIRFAINIRTIVYRQMQKTPGAYPINDLGIVPFTGEYSVAASLSQLYYWHDALYANNVSVFPRNASLVPLEHNKPSDPPICADFTLGLTRFTIWRGTKTNVEVAIDLDVAQVHNESLGGLVHRGFSKVLTQVMKVLNQRSTAAIEQHIIFGHSLGGALTQLSTVLFPNSIGYASAAPRSCSPQVAQGFEGLVQRLTTIVNHADVINHVPLSVTDIGFAQYYYEVIDSDFIRFNNVKATLADCHITNTYVESINSNVTNGYDRTL